MIAFRHSIYTLAVLMLCAACTPAQRSADSQQLSRSADAEGYPLRITHALGETIIEKKPERIATIGWSNQDVPLALGVAPVGFSAAVYGRVTEKRIHPWTEAAINSLGGNPVIFDDSDGWDYEAISDTRPDVILAAYSSITPEEYDLLSQIAPVVTYPPEKPYLILWREQTIKNAEGMGMKSEGEALVAHVEALIAEKLAEHPNLAGKRAVFVRMGAENLSSFHIYLPAGARAAFLLDMGLAFPESVKTLAAESTTYVFTMSREHTDLLSDVDMMVLYGTPSLLEAMQADPLINRIPAVKNGAVALIDPESDLSGSALSPTILSIPQTIDAYLTLLSEAAARVSP